MTVYNVCHSETETETARLYSDTIFDVRIREWFSFFFFFDFLIFWDLILVAPCRLCGLCGLCGTFPLSGCRAVEMCRANFGFKLPLSLSLVTKSRILSLTISPPAQQ